MKEAERSELKVFLFKFLIIIAGLAAFVILGIGSVFMGLTMLFSLADTDVVEEDVVKIVELDGQISETAGFGGEISPRYVRESLEQARDNNAKAVVLRVNSPGGTVAASQEIASIIADFELPTVISMADSATSGGYYISAGADKILAHETTTTGSIGVISVLYNLEELYDTLGVEVEVIKSGEYKDLGYDSLGEEEREILQNLSDEMYTQFVTDVADYRGLSEDDVYDIATGEIMTGARAYDLDLVDDLGGVDDAIDAAGELAGISDPNGHWMQPEGIWDGFIIPLIEQTEILGDDFILDYQISEESDDNYIPQELPEIEFRYQNKH